MRITLSIPDRVVGKLRAAVPARQRSRLVCRLLEAELARHENALAAACREANRDRALEREIGEWQSFDEGAGSDLRRSKKTCHI